MFTTAVLGVDRAGVWCIEGREVSMLVYACIEFELKALFH